MGGFGSFFSLGFVGLFCCFLICLLSWKLHLNTRFYKTRCKICTSRNDEVSLEAHDDKRDYGPKMLGHYSSRTPIYTLRASTCMSILASTRFQWVFTCHTVPTVPYSKTLRSLKFPM